MTGMATTQSILASCRNPPVRSTTMLSAACWLPLMLIEPMLISHCHLVLDDGSTPSGVGEHVETFDDLLTMVDVIVDSWIRR